MRDIALDVHIGFCEVAIAEGGGVRSAGWIETKPEAIELFAGSLDARDRVALEVIATQALDSAQIRRLMTVPGVNMICAATCMAAIGEIGPLSLRAQAHGLPRARSAGESVGVLPGDPRADLKAGIGRGPPRPGGGELVEVRQPGPMHAFYQRIRSRRGHQVAIIACARKLGCLFSCLLTREEDYAYAQPSLTAKKLRLLEIRAGAKTLKGTPTGTWATRQKMRTAERKLAAQAETAYERMVAEWQATQAKGKGAGATPGRASRGPSSGQAARQAAAPEPAL